MEELLKTFETEIETITLIPSDGGRFELSINGELIYSKLKTSRHVEEGELIGLVQKYQQESR